MLYVHRLELEHHRGKKEDPPGKSNMYRTQKREEDDGGSGREGPLTYSTHGVLQIIGPLKDVALETPVQAGSAALRV